MNNFFTKGGSILIVIIIVVIVIGVVAYFAFLKDEPLENKIINEPIESNSVNSDIEVKEETKGMIDCIDDKVCFEEKFVQCEPATIVIELMEILVYYYEIIGPKNGFCEVKSKFNANPNPEWTGKEMICTYDNSQNFETAIKDMSRCEGSLYELMMGT